MTIPAFIFGFIISSLIGAVFHVWKGGGLGRLFLYMAFCWAGFAAGQAIASYWGWSFDTVGPLHVAVGSTGAVMVLVLGYWLSLVEVEKQKE